MSRATMLKRVITVDGRTVRRNLMVLFFLALFVVIIDQWTKRWADNNLATRRHPLPVQIETSSTIQGALTDHFGMSEPEVLALINEGFIALLAERPLTSPEARVYPPGGAQAARAVYVFHNGTSRAPRLGVFYHRERRRLDAQNSEGGKLSAKTRGKIDQEFSEFTLLEAVREILPSRSDAAIRGLIEKGRVYSIRLGQRLRPGDELKAGEILLVQRKTLTVISGFLRFTYAENPGAAWSFLATASPHFRYWFFTLISIIAVTFLLGLAINQTPDNRLALAAYGLILGGAIGNFIDRQTTNYVVDFIDMYIGSSHWPTYNVADIGISVGVSLLLIAMVLERKKEKAA